MSFNVLITSSFEKEVKKLAKKYPSIGKDLKKFIDVVAESPIIGKPLGKDCYKVRMAISSKGKGKSGGARIITW